MNILFLTEYYQPHIGGQELLFGKIVKGISHNNIQCTVITSRTDKKSPKCEKYENIIIYRLDIPNFLFRFFFVILSVIKSKKLKNDFELIHGST